MKNNQISWKEDKAKGMTFKRVEEWHEEEENEYSDGHIEVVRTTYYADIPENTIENILIYLNTEPKYADKIKWNKLTKKFVFDGIQFNNKIWFFDVVISHIIYDVESDLGFHAPSKVKHAINILTSMPENQIYMAPEKIFTYHNDKKSEE